MKSSFDFGRALVLRDTTNDLVAYLCDLVEEEGFRCGPETVWAYDRVRSHLDDSGTAVAGWCGIDRDMADKVTYLVNPLIRGTSPETVGEGERPTRHDLAAYVYFKMTKPLSERHAA